MTHSLLENPKVERDGHFDGRLGERWLCWMAPMAPVFQNKAYVDVCHWPDVSHGREKVSEIVLDSVQKDHLEGGKTTTGKRQRYHEIPMS